MEHLKFLDFLQKFEESSKWISLLQVCEESCLQISLFKWLVSAVVTQWNQLANFNRKSISSKCAQLYIFAALKSPSNEWHAEGLEQRPE